MYFSKPDKRGEGLGLFIGSGRLCGVEHTSQHLRHKRACARVLPPPPRAIPSGIRVGVLDIDYLTLLIYLKAFIVY